MSKQDKKVEAKRAEKIIKAREKVQVKLNKNQTIMLYKTKEKEINDISAKLQEMDKVYLDIVRAEGTLKELQKKNLDNPILINLGAGVLVKCKILELDKIKLMLPGSILVDKSLSEVYKDIDRQKKDIETTRTKLIELYTKSARTLNSVATALQKMEQAKASKGIDKLEESSIN
ncbi:MAG: hypothetical protein V1824_00895 [archaeon]